MYSNPVPLFVSIFVILVAASDKVSSYKVSQNNKSGPIFRPPISVQDIPNVGKSIKVAVVVDPSNSTSSTAKPLTPRRPPTPGYKPTAAGVKCWNPEKCGKYCKDLGFAKCVMHSCKKCQCDNSSFNSKLLRKP